MSTDNTVPDRFNTQLLGLAAVVGLAVLIGRPFNRPVLPFGPNKLPSPVESTLGADNVGQFGPAAPGAE